MITVTAFQSVPDFAQGLVRDLRVRWALEEAGIPYDVRLIGRPDDQNAPAYRRQQPFGQVPVLTDGDLTLFESGAIVLYIANKSDALMPQDDAGRARATGWVLAALNSIEPWIMNLLDVDVFSPMRELEQQRRPFTIERIEKRLDELATWLGDREYLEDRFTAGDLMMTTVLRILRHTDLVDGHKVLGPYKARCEARPAFQRALDGQMSAFKAA